MKKHTGTSAPAKQVRMNSVGWMLKQLGAQLDSEMSRALKQIGLNINQFAMLMTLNENEGLTQSEIGQKISMPAYAITRTLDALEVVQYVERRIDERSRRSFRIYLTDKGKQISPKLFAIVGRVNAELLSPLSETEQLQFKQILHKIRTTKPE